jgi:hypothetical protein
MNERKTTDDPFLVNIRNTEVKLGIKKGNEMTFEEANELKGNVNYAKKGSKYLLNCQSCVVANELRRRGFDVTARPSVKKKGNIPNQLSHKTEMAWIDPATSKMPKKQHVGGEYFSNGSIKTKTQSVMTKELLELTKEVGRYNIDFIWKGDKCGHILTLERLENKEILLYDPQSGELKMFKYYLNRISLKYGITVLRIDKLFINTDIIDGIVVKL